jgi:hypothetical protein
VCFDNLFTTCIYRSPSVQIYNLHPPSTSLPFNSSSLQKTDGNVTLDSRSKVYLNIQIHLNLDFQARISIFLFLAILSWSSLRGTALAQLTARVLVEWVTTRRQRLLCDIGCVLSAMVFGISFELVKLLSRLEGQPYTLSAILCFLFRVFFEILTSNG